MAVSAADTSSSSLSMIKETTWGVKPTTGTWAYLRFTGESLSIDKSTTQSDEIRKDKQISDLISTKIEASGDFNGEFSSTTYETFIKAVLGVSTAWTDKSEGISGASVSTGGVLKFSAKPTFVFTPGMAIGIKGFSNAENNGIVVVISAVVDGTGLNVTVAPKLAVEGTAQTITVYGSLISNDVTGAELPSYSIQKEFGDVNKYLLYRGMTVGTMGLTVSAEDKVGVSFGFMGAGGESATSAFTSGTITPATTTEICTSVLKNSAVYSDGSRIALIKSLSLDISQNLRGRSAIGSAGNVSIGVGRFTVTGNVSLYFKDFALYDKYLKNESSSLVFTIGDPKGNYVVFHMPAIKMTSATIVAGGPDQDVMVEGSYQALLDETLKKTLMLTKMKTYVPNA